jgi:uncharacterized membrane protein
LNTKSAIVMGLAVIGGAAVIEAALVPAVVIGGAAVLAPRYLPKLRRRLQSAVTAPFRSSAEPQTARSASAQSAKPRAAESTTKQPFSVPAGFGLKQAVLKTITFRVIVTTLDFTVNLVVIGELSTAAGLSTFNLVAGPLFYLAHEAGWNYLGQPGDAPVDVPLGFSVPVGDKTRVAGFTISRPLAKTITFRTLATIMDFTTNYVVVRDVATAVVLSASGFILGPFVYYGHEKLWDYYGARGESEVAASPKLLSAPATR